MWCAILSPPPASAICFLAYSFRAHVRMWVVWSKRYVIHCAIGCLFLFFIWAFGMDYWVIWKKERLWPWFCSLTLNVGLIFNPILVGHPLMSHGFRKHTSWETPIEIVWSHFPILYLSFPSVHYEPYTPPPMSRCTWPWVHWVIAYPFPLSTYLVWALKLCLREVDAAKRKVNIILWPHERNKRKRRL